MAAHLEHLTRETGGGILLTEDTPRNLDGDYLVERADLLLRESDRSIPVYRFLGYLPDVPPAAGA